MKPPHDGDRSSSEDGLIAEVIPLRRRDPGRLRGAEQPFEPERSDVFDPPPEPEPLAEYSVWERPTAELLRREPPEPPAAALSPLAERAWVRVPRWLAPATVAIVAAVMLTLASFRLAGHPQSPAKLGQSGSQAGLGQPIASSTTQRSASGSTSRRGAHRGPRRERTPASSHRDGSSQSHPLAVRPRQTSEEAASVRYATTTSSPAASAHTQGSAGAGAPAVATAAREFGFER